MTHAIDCQFPLGPRIISKYDEYRVTECLHILPRHAPFYGTPSTQGERLIGRGPECDCTEVVETCSRVHGDVIVKAMNLLELTRRDTFHSQYLNRKGKELAVFLNVRNAEKMLSTVEAVVAAASSVTRISAFLFLRWVYSTNLPLYPSV